MPAFPPIAVRSPIDHDLVGAVVSVCGVATGFEGKIAARVRDGDGAVLVEDPIAVGGTGIWDLYEHPLALPGVPSTDRGTVEVFEYSEAGDGTELHQRVVPVVFGTALVAPDEYAGFAPHTVSAGETLSGIARLHYGDPGRYTVIFAANRDQLDDPDHIRVGQVLRIPQHS